MQFVALPDSTGYEHVCLAPGSYEALSENISAGIAALEYKNIEIERLEACILNHNAEIGDESH